MNEEMLAQIVSTIVHVVSPEQVILFGFHARGDAKPESDLDLLVIESGEFDRTRSRRSETRVRLSSETSKTRVRLS